MPRAETRVRPGLDAGSACPACQAAKTIHQNFCSGCGTPPTRAGRPSPDHLQQRIRNASIMLEAERKYVTILFADVVGSTALIRDLDPEQVGAILDPVLQGMVRAVHEHGGVVTRIQGDGIMALFGAPLAQEEHAGRACRAALDIRALLADPRVTTRIGLHSGEVALRVIRNAGAVEYDAVGACVHLAAWMEQTAAPRTIRVSNTTSQLLQAQFELRPLGSIAVKDASERRIPVFEVVGEADLRSPWSEASSRSLSPFINRATEITRMKAAAAAAEAGLGQVVAISGHAGTGKSRLIHEFSATLDRAGWQILEASPVREERSVSYRPFIRVLRDCLDMDLDGQRCPLARELARALAAAHPQLKNQLAPLSALFGTTVEDPSWTTMAPAIRRRRILEAVVTVICQTAARRKLLLLVEDVHWFDRESDALLDHLIDALSTQRALVVATYRPGYHERWKRNAGYHQIRLRPLSAPDCHRLLDATLGVHPSLSAVKAHLASRTQGVPLFVEEMVRTLSETGVLDGTSGNFRTSALVNHIQIPDSIQPVLAARIDRLSAEPKEILQVAAVIGNDFDVPLLAEALGRSPTQLAPHLAVLESGDFIFAKKRTTVARFAFRHVLIQEATYRSLLSTKRQQIHAAIAGGIENLYPQRLKEEAEALAHHSFEGRLWEPAVTKSQAGGPEGNRARRAPAGGPMDRGGAGSPGQSARDDPSEGRGRDRVPPAAARISRRSGSIRPMARQCGRSRTARREARRPGAHPGHSRSSAAPAQRACRHQASGCCVPGGGTHGSRPR